MTQFDQLWTRTMETKFQVASLVETADQKTVSKFLGISQQYLCDLLHGRRGISENIANKLGYDKITVFKKKESK